MGYLIGVFLALATGVFATVVGFDRSRTFYASVLLVVGHYYTLFAIMGGSLSALWPELLVFGAFVALSVMGYRLSEWLLVAGLLGHGALDAVHGSIVDNPGVPDWWPAFCLAFDVAAGAYLALRISTRSTLTRGHAHSRALADGIAEARTLLRSERYAEAMPHLERAHVLGQRIVGPHVVVHWLMFRAYVGLRRPGAALGQLARLVLGALGSAVGVLPVGNTGGSDVGMFRRMPIPSELARLMSGHEEAAPQRGRVAT